MDNNQSDASRDHGPWNACGAPWQFCSGTDSRQVLVRRAKAIHGRIRSAMLCEPCFDYARAGSTLEHMDSRVVFRSDGTDGLVMCLSVSVQLEVEGDAAVAEFELGLFSEQLDQEGRSLGNIPQTFTHLAIISAAYNLHRRLNSGVIG